jgi:hypothetical protein
MVEQYEIRPSLNDNLKGKSDGALKLKPGIHGVKPGKCKWGRAVSIA